MAHSDGSLGILLLLPVAVSLAACGAGNGLKEGTAAASVPGRLSLRIENAATAADGPRCIYAVTARNDTGAPALNVQAAWMARTEGFGIISDFQLLGDFAAGEARMWQLGVIGAPCNAVRDLTLTRAVCVVGPATDPPQSCAALVALDGGKVVSVRKENRSAGVDGRN